MNNRIADNFEDLMETIWMDSAEKLQKETTLAGQAQINAVVWMNKIYRNSLQCAAVLKFFFIFVAIKLHIKAAPQYRSSKPVILSAPNTEKQETASILSVVPNSPQINLQD